MTYYDERLKRLHMQVARARQLDAMIQELHRQRDTLVARVNELEAIMIDEQTDVDRLEGRSLTALFYNVIGKRNEQLDKERAEAYAARVKYDSASLQLKAVNNYISQYESELASMHDCHEMYAAALTEKAAAIKAANGAQAGEIMRYEERKAFLENQQSELLEAISIGNSALQTTQQVLKHLKSAKNWGTYDLLGGGFWSDSIKHDHLDKAQNSIEQLQVQLRCFKTELADVSINADIQISVDGYLRFADFFWDDLLSNWTVLDKIEQSQSQVQNIQKQIKDVLEHLHSLTDGIQQEQAQLLPELEALIRNVHIET